MFDAIAFKDYRLIAPATGAWLAAWVLTSEKTPWIAAFLLLATTQGIIGWRMRRWLVLAVSITCLGISLIAGIQLQLLRSGLMAELSQSKSVMEVEFLLSSEPKVFPASNRAPYAIAQVKLLKATAYGETYELRQRAEFSLQGEEVNTPLQVGGRYRAVVRVQPPDPGERLVTSMSLRGSLELLSEPGPVNQFANRLRAGLVHSMRHSTERQAGLVPSLVVGDVSNLPKEVADSFKVTGLTHLTAVSGSNLTLLMAFVIGMLSLLGVHGWPLRIVALLVVPFFVLLCRNEPSVVRAAAMGLVAMAATGVSPNSSGIRNLSLAVLGLLLIDPWLSRSWGFALSVSASSGILFLGSRWQRKMRSWAPGWLAEALCIPLSAQLATQPLVTALSGTVSFAAVAANALSGPFVGPVTVLGILSAIFSLVSSWFAGVVGFVAGLCVQPILSISAWLSALPAANWRWSSSWVSLTILVFICIGFGMLADMALGKSWAAFLLFGSLILASCFRPLPMGWPGDWQVVICDVGQGSAAVLRVAPRIGILVDAGPEGNGAVQCLQSLRLEKVPLVIISHAHADHIGGLPAVLENYEVEQVASSDPSGVERFLKHHGISMKVASILASNDFKLGEVNWETIAPLKSPEADVETVGATSEENSVENDSSVVARVEVAGVTVLLTGDVEPSGQQVILDSSERLQSNVLIMPHHGSSRQSAEFFEKTMASVAIASAGEKNSYGHPAPKTVQLAESLSMRVFRTDKHGSIAISRTKSGVLEVRTYR